MTTVVVTSRSFGQGSKDLIAQAAQSGLTLVWGPPHHALFELGPALATAEAWIAGTGPVTAEHMDQAPQLKVIARYGVGVEAVDLQAAAERGIVVTNTPGANSDAVADLALALMLNAVRHVTRGDRQVRHKDWSSLRGQELGALTIGIVGFGRIGQGVARRLSGFGATVLGADPYVQSGVFDDCGVRQASVDDVFEQCDVITLHAPGGQVLVTQARLAQMRPGAVLVNTARADLVDEEALARALRAGTLGAYASDVLSGDTAASESPLLAEDLAAVVIVTPHLGAQTVQAVDTMGQLALDNVRAVLEGGQALHPVSPPPGKETP